jgi:hypothetical protein
MLDRAWVLRCCSGLGLGLLLVGLFLTAFSIGAKADDAPVHRTARLSYLQGNVTVERMDNTGGDPAELNMPLPDGLRVTTGEDGQAEVEFEDGSLVRLTPNSSLGLNALSVDGDGNFATHLAVLHGLVYAELRATTKFTYSVEASGDSITPVANAVVRIDLDESPASIAVLDGSLHVQRADTDSAAGYQTDVRAGETLTADAADSSRYFLTPAITQDSWDQWNEDRDQSAADEAGSRTTARDNYAGDQGYGWSDLDANGSWYDVPGEGKVWQPPVAVDASFDPYGYGSWISYPGAGYVWASGYGWGWLPYRCGNWSYWDGFGWGWMPSAGCGLYRWGVGGGGYVVNVIRPPLNYRFPVRPVHGSGPGHPIHIGRPFRPEGPPAQINREPRMIAGQTVEPLRPTGVGASSFRGSSAVGSALRRDYPVDRSSHQPTMGVVATPNSSTQGNPWRSGAREGNPHTGQNGTESGRQPRSAPPAPVQRSAPPSAPRPSPPPSPPPSAPHPAAPATPR